MTSTQRASCHFGGSPEHQFLATFRLSVASSEELIVSHERLAGCDPSIPPEEFLGPPGPKMETELKMSSWGLPAPGPQEVKNRVEKESRKSVTLVAAMLRCCHPSGWARVLLLLGPIDDFEAASLRQDVQQVRVSLCYSLHPPVLCRLPPVKGFTERKNQSAPKGAGKLVKRGKCQKYV